MNSLRNVSRGDVADPVGGVVLPDVVADGLEQVGLAQAGVAVDEQRVVLPGRGLGHGEGGGVGEAVGRADDEGVEGVPRVDVVRPELHHRVPGAGRGGRWGARRSRPARARAARSRGPARRRRRRSRRGRRAPARGSGPRSAPWPGTTGRRGVSRAPSKLTGAGGLEGGEPHRFGHLGPQDPGALVPQPLCLVHAEPASCSRDVHSDVHTCGKARRPARTGARDEPVDATGRPPSTVGRGGGTQPPPAAVTGSGTVAPRSPALARGPVDFVIAQVRGGG